MVTDINVNRGLYTVALVGQCTDNDRTRGAALTGGEKNFLHTPIIQCLRLEPQQEVH